MTHKLSEKAVRKRRDDFLLVASEKSTIEVTYLTLCAVMLLIAQETHKLMHKLTPMQRTALAAVVVVAGGGAMFLLIKWQVWGLALVAMFFLGWLLSEISRS